MTRGSPTTKAECIEALHEAAQILGESPSRPQYDELGLSPSPSAIYNHFDGWNNAKQAAGLETVGVGGKLDINSSYFDEINSSEKAYWLGLLWADGCILEDRPAVSLGLKDREHIEKFRAALDADHTIREFDGLFRISFSNEQLWQSLQELGFTPEKTTDGSLPPLEDSDYRRAFVRGYFDGDGHYESGRLRITSMSERRLCRLKSWIPFSTTVFERGDGVHTLQTAARLEFHVFSWLYNADGGADEPKLDRKFDTWNEKMLSVT